MTLVHQPLVLRPPQPAGFPGLVARRAAAETALGEDGVQIWHHWAVRQV